MNAAAPGIALLFAAVLLSVRAPVHAADDSPESFAVHGQATYTEQETSGFNAPYAGRNSLTPNSGAETVDATLFLGKRLWPGSEIWISPEIDQGFGLDDTLGVAGFPSGEAYKVGKDQPYVRLQRLFVRQTFNLDDRREAVESAQLQLPRAPHPQPLGRTAGQKR